MMKFFRKNFFKRLQKGVEFSLAITKPNGNIPQIGDNDNNRFLKFTPIFKNAEAEFPEENYNNHLHLAGAFKGFSDDICKNDFDDFTIDTELMRGLLKATPLSFKSDFKQSESYSFPDFGLYIFKNEKYYCAIRCGAIGQNGKGGHAHNDQLSFELNVAGEDIIIDPGTYMYSGLPQRRNEFRSTAMHNTLFLKDIEQNELPSGSIDSLFWMMNERTKAKGFLKDSAFKGKHFGFGEPHERQINFENSKIIGSDIYPTTVLKTAAFHFATGVFVSRISDTDFQIQKGKNSMHISFKNGVGILKEYDYSEQYGKIKQAFFLEVEFLDSKLNWQISVE